MSTIHAFDYLDSNLDNDASIVALFGDEGFLQVEVRKRLVRSMAGDEGEEFASYIDGDEAEWRDVIDNLNTVSLFGGSLQIVVVKNADDFVKKHRTDLEKYVAKPTKSGRLILHVGTWAANTKLYKSIDKTALQIECGVPQIKRGKSKSRDTKKLNAWIQAWAQTHHQLKITLTVAALLIDLVEDDFGRLDQELAKLAVIVDPGQKITPELVEEVVGGWRTKTIWQAVDSAVAGETKEALELLGRLIQAGEHPLAMFGQLSWSLRRYGRVLEEISRCERASQKPNWDAELARAGFQRWAGGLDKSKQQLRQLGRKRTSNMYRWLAETDLALKGSHSDAKRSRLVLEKLFADMSNELSTGRSAKGDTYLRAVLTENSV